MKIDSHNASVHQILLIIIDCCSPIVHPNFTLRKHVVTFILEVMGIKGFLISSRHWPTPRKETHNAYTASLQGQMEGNLCMQNWFIDQLLSTTRDKWIKIYWFMIAEIGWTSLQLTHLVGDAGAWWLVCWTLDSGSSNPVQDITVLCSWARHFLTHWRPYRP